MCLPPPVEHRRPSKAQAISIPKSRASSWPGSPSQKGASIAPARRLADRCDGMPAGSQSVTWWPRLCSRKACQRPVMPAPRTSIFAIGRDLMQKTKKSKQAAMGHRVLLRGKGERRSRYANFLPGRGLARLLADTGRGNAAPSPMFCVCSSTTLCLCQASFGRKHMVFPESSRDPYFKAIVISCRFPSLQNRRLRLATPRRE